MELVVGAQSWQGSHSNTVGKEDLSGSINPCLALLQLAPVWSDIVDETVGSSLQGESSAQEDGHHKVGEESGEPDDLAGAVETLGNDAVDTEPGQGQAPHQLQVDAAQSVLQTTVDAQHSVARNRNLECGRRMRIQLTPRTPLLECWCVSAELSCCLWSH